MTRLVVASYNTHAGVDGWGRPFDAVSNCLKLEADVLVLQELFEPDEAPSPVEELAQRGGYQAIRAPGTAGRIYGPEDRDPSDATSGDATGWGPLVRRRAGVGLTMQLPRRRLDTSRGQGGAAGLVVLSRLPVTTHRLADLGQLPNDVPRTALIVEVQSAEAPLTIVGVHMGHLQNGSPFQFRRLGAVLRGLKNAVVLGDMNVWGPPLKVLLPGWRRVVRGPTWPSWRPRFQIDHALVAPGTAARGTVESSLTGSDHLPIRVEVDLGSS